MINTIEDLGNHVIVSAVKDGNTVILELQPVHGAHEIPPPIAIVKIQATHEYDEKRTRHYRLRVSELYEEPVTTTVQKERSL